MTSETYTTILQVARRLFARQGYTATSVRQIAAETGIGKATIYHHFPDKQAIAAALLTDSLAQMNDMLAVIRAEPDPRRRLRTAVEMSLQFLVETSGLFQIVRREVPGGRAQLQHAMTTFFRTYIGMLAETLAQGQAQGIFRAMDATAGARVLLTMIQGTYAMTYITGQRLAPPEAATEALLDVFLHGVEKRGA
jgi:AcrR family transcriptional regulator